MHQNEPHIYQIFQPKNIHDLSRRFKNSAFTLLRANKEGIKDIKGLKIKDI